MSGGLPSEEVRLSVSSSGGETLGVSMAGDLEARESERRGLRQCHRHLQDVQQEQTRQRANAEHGEGKVEVVRHVFSMGRNEEVCRGQHKSLWR